MAAFPPPDRSAGVAWKRVEKTLKFLLQKRTGLFPVVLIHGTYLFGQNFCQVAQISIGKFSSNCSKLSSFKWPTNASKRFSSFLALECSKSTALALRISFQILLSPASSQMAAFYFQLAKLPNVLLLPPGLQEVPRYQNWNNDGENLISCPEKTFFSPREYLILLEKTLFLVKCQSSLDQTSCFQNCTS